MPINQFTNGNIQAASEKTDHLPTMQMAVNVCTAQGKRTPAEKTIVYIGRILPVPARVSTHLQWIASLGN